ncbi:DMT family transporter [Neobacillus sedimentimangrovi]|uniref:DMT family transporter n=1 Tax=Neobacillus sedimentimangrovi TaxID=2699460 RepID=A0ABS8QFM7_9BACI|nr:MULTISPECIES: DMT family transporter [Neobacillus]MCD4838040.1 DMT family transporter [Neobacillus sedimentimangrovi]MED3625142.1 DMT family transporter [Neobacillus thermocopriae]MED3712819.1 DMT family transporter [Neobacillus thermocopriae]
MKNILYYIIALLAGVTLSIEGTIYAELGESIGKLESSLYNFAVGSIILGIALLFLGKGSLSYTFKAPKWQLSGGLLGVIYLTILVIGIPIVGVGLAMSSVVVGQMVMSMIIEHKGWLGSPKIKVKKEKIIAVALMIVSLVLIY